MLVANDEQFLLQHFQAVLEDFFEVHVAENGVQALQMVKNEVFNFFDIIFLDLNMPIMDGWEACQRISMVFSEKDPLSMVLSSSMIKAPEAKKPPRDPSRLDG